MKLVKVVSFSDTSNTMLYSILKLVGLLSFIGFIGQTIMNFLTPIVFTQYHNEQFPMLFLVFSGMFTGMYLGMCIQKQKDDKKYVEGNYK